MRFTDRDRDLLCWINGHGFVSIAQAARWMGTSYQASQKRMRLLVDGGYLERDWVLREHARVHRVTDKGVLAAEDFLTPLRSVYLGTYRHDRLLVDLAQTLTHKTGGVFEPERRLRQKLGRKGARGHAPDGLLRIDDQQPIAIELELSVKSKDRLAEIVANYVADRSLSEVWYFVNRPAVRRLLTDITTGYGLFRIHDWEPAA